MELTAGPELNLRIAREVMEEDVPDGYERAGDHWEKEEPIFDDDGAYTRIWQVVEWPALYSEHIAGAWQVVERMRENGVLLRIEPRASCYIVKAVTWNVTQDCEELIAHSAQDTAPLAICLAALKAVGVEVELEGV
jgi:hypothetical protein